MNKVIRKVVKASKPVAMMVTKSVKTPENRVKNLRLKEKIETAEGWKRRIH